MSALPVKIHCLLFDHTEVPQPLPIMLECCLLTPVAPRPLRACRGKVHQPLWSPSLVPHSPNSLSSRRHGLPRVHQVRCAEGKCGGRGVGQMSLWASLIREEIARGLGSFAPCAWYFLHSTWMLFYRLWKINCTVLKKSVSFYDSVCRRLKNFRINPFLSCFIIQKSVRKIPLVKK